MFTVLHLENSSMYRKLLESICEELGVNYLDAGTLQDAFGILNEHDVDLIITAIELKDGRSHEFITRINESEYHRIPIVVFTGNDTPDDRFAMYRLGIVDYLSKKASSDEIRAALSSYVKFSDPVKGMVGLRIAVCDDSTMDRYIIQRIFTLQGLTEIEYFENEDELLSSETNFDIYLIDLVLRSMSGRNVVYALRQRHPDSVIIAVSGIDSVKTISSVLSAGADDYITKPFNSDLFMARLSTNARTYLLRRKLIQANARLQEMAITDSLTGLYNHQYIFDRLEQEVNSSRRYGGDFSILMLDLDFFKQINDNCGHQVGDEVLRQVAGVIRATLRDVDIAGRYGGEEFLVILMHTPPEQARIAADRVRSGVEGLSVRCLAKPVTISGGLCSYEGQDPIEMVRTADEYLYRAKNNGRNRIEW